MARMKFLCDAERCIECNACVTACKNEHEVPWGVNRRRVVTIQDGKPGERSISVACMHCSDAPCMAVCPVDCFYQTDQGVVLHSKELLNFHNLVILAQEVKWIYVPSVQVDHRMICLIMNSKSMEETDLLKESFLSVQKCVLQKHF